MPGFTGVFDASEEAGLALWRELASFASHDGLTVPTPGVHHLRSLALASALMSTHSTAYDTSFERTVSLAQRATLGQLELMGLPWAEPASLTGYEWPSQALGELAARRGVTLTPDQWDSVRGLDASPEPLGGALTRFVDAFLVLDAAAEVALDPGRFPGMEARWEVSLKFAGRLERNPDAGVQREGRDVLDLPVAAEFDDAAWLADLSFMLGARVLFLDSILELQRAAMASPAASGDCQPMQVHGLYSIDLGSCDSTYIYDYVMLLDFGGNDWYNNNAGGSNLNGGYICGPPLVVGGRAALVDFGSGNDLYGYPAAPMRCGVNGGAFFGGMGFLLDEGGGDVYVGEYLAINGGAQLLSSGFLLDGSGNDAYIVSGGSSNGGGFDLGLGMLLDTGGDDVYIAGAGATNGGGFSSAARMWGRGFLWDTEGNDQYAANCIATNGGGASFGRGFLLDLSGNDSYRTSQHSYCLGRDDGTNGGGAGGSTGFLFDAAGDDSYRAGGAATNGGGVVAGEGMLIDLSGNDGYVATSEGTNGGGAGAGVGFLVDVMGDDTYEAGERGTNGGGGSALRLVTIPAGVGLLLDGGGRDSYRDAIADCQDCTVVPKELAGAQVDSG